MRPRTNISAEAEERREQRVIARAQGGDRRAVERLLAAYRPMAIAYASRWAIPGCDMSDMLQLALIGVSKAIRTYDPARGTRTLSTLAHLCIHRELEHKLRESLGSQDLSEGRRGARRAVWRAASLDETVVSAYAGVGVGCSRSDLLPSTTSYGESAGAIAVARVIHDELMNALPIGERSAVALDAAGYSQAEIGAQLGVSQLKVSRMLLRVRRRIARL
jgi:RNA polymerase sigma factor (sigma-70 family)